MTETKTPVREDRDILEEILMLSRRLNVEKNDRTTTRKQYDLIEPLAVQFLHLFRKSDENMRHELKWMGGLFLELVTNIPNPDDTTQALAEALARSFES
jgi:hypothetical protein